MKKVTTSIRLKQIMAERGLKQVDIINACRPYCEQYGLQLKKNDLSQYVSGKVEPKQDKLSILGLALNVNEVWLMGYDVPSGRDELSTIENNSHKNTTNLFQLIEDEYDKTTCEFFSMYCSLDAEDKAEVRGEVKQMLKAHKYSTKDGLKNA